jgi:hypothetical protein
MTASTIEIPRDSPWQLSELNATKIWLGQEITALAIEIPLDFL